MLLTPQTHATRRHETTQLAVTVRQIMSAMQWFIFNRNTLLDLGLLSFYLCIQAIWTAVCRYSLLCIGLDSAIIRCAICGRLTCCIIVWYCMHFFSLSFSLVVSFIVLCTDIFMCVWRIYVLKINHNPVDLMRFLQLERWRITMSSLKVRSRS